MTRSTDGFAARVREVTRADHQAAQSTAYFDALLGGSLSVAGYAALPAQQYFIYQTLEQAGTAMRDDPVVGPLLHPALERLPALSADLDHLIGPDWPHRIAPLPATVAYVARLREVCFDWPAGFVAHHYTRLMGDLSGGQIMRRTLERSYAITDQGTNFYDFPGLDAHDFKRSYRQRLDAVEWGEPERERFLAEVATAYRLNIAVLDDLAGAVLSRDAA